MSFVLQGGLGSLWSMLNSQQVAVYMPMFEKLKFPPSAMTITKKMIKLATFDLIPTEWISDMLWYFPEGEAFSLNFETAGIESKLFLQNIGLTLYLVLFNILYGLLHGILVPFKSKSKFLEKTVKKMDSYLYFNGTIRFYMEVFFDIILVASLNLQTADWETPFIAEKASNYISISFIVLISIWPVGCILVACIKPKKWVDEKFKSRCGTILE